MTKIEMLIKQLHLENFLLQILNGATDSEDHIAEKLEQSFDDVFEAVEKLYDGADREDERLFDAISSFAAIHDDTYFSAGVITGANFMKRLEEEYHKQWPEDVAERLHKETKDIKNSKASGILQQIIEMRMDSALEESFSKGEVSKNTKQAKTSEQSEQSEQCLQGVHFTPEQWHAIDKALAENNASSAEYGRQAYKQGFLDAFTLLREMIEESS